MTTRLVIPLLNQRVTLFPGPTWYLDEPVLLDALSTDEYGLVYRDAPDEYKAQLGPRTKALKIKSVSPDSCEDRAKTDTAVVSFILNYFRREHPVATKFALQITEKRKARLDRIIEVGTGSEMESLRNCPYSVRDKSLRSTATDFYKVVSQVVARDSSVLLTLRRFNSALTRCDTHDQIVDITIALETLINGTSELSNRFAVYNAWAADADVGRRAESYKLLQALYSARSAIVHGQQMSEKDYAKKIKPVIDDWQKVVDVASRAIGYQLLYLYNHDCNQWFSHQRELCLGVAKRITHR